MSHKLKLEFVCLGAGDGVAVDLTVPTLTHAVAVVTDFMTRFGTPDAGPQELRITMFSAP